MQSIQSFGSQSKPIGHPIIRTSAYNQQVSNSASDESRKCQIWHVHAEAVHLLLSIHGFPFALYNSIFAFPERWNVPLKSSSSE
jgi:hypothetical protein